MKIDDNGRRLAATRNHGKIFINGRFASSRLSRFHSRWDSFVMEMRHNYVSSVASCTFIFLLARAEQALYSFLEIRCAFRPRIPHAKTAAFKSERRGKQKGENGEVRISSIVSHPFPNEETDFVVSVSSVRVALIIIVIVQRQTLSFPSLFTRSSRSNRSRFTLPSHSFVQNRLIACVSSEPSVPKRHAETFKIQPR